MTIWNPYAFGPTGQPLAPQSPPALRVEGPNVATPQQRAMAQAVFHQFAMVQRVSLGPNPTQSGQLPDGTPYRIVTTGPQTIMQIWPAAGDDDRFSGIAITLVNLDGTPIPGHVDADGSPVAYLLTPQLEGKTRKSNGKWKVRKPKGMSGGKAVNAAKGGLFYYTGIDGVPDVEVPLIRATGYGINGLAYDDEDDGVNAQLYKNSAFMGRSRDNPIPFLFQKGEVRLPMQVQFISEFVDGSFKNRVELWVGSATQAQETICYDLVDSQVMPTGRLLDRESITFKDDGTEARATGQAPGGFGFYTIRFTPTGFSVSLDRTQARDRVAGTLWRQSGRASSSGTPGVVGTYTTTGDVIYGTQPPTEDYGATEPFEGSGNYNVVGEILGEIDFYDYGPDSYKFDRRGQPVSDAGDRRRVHVSGYSTRHFSETVVIAPRPNNLLGFTVDINSLGIEHREKTDVRYGAFGSEVLVDYTDDWELRGHTFYPDSGGAPSIQELEVTGQGHYYANSSGPAPLFEDDELEFAVYYDIKNMRRQEWTWKLMPESSQGYGRDFTKDEITYESTLKVKCKGAELLSVSVDLQGFKRHVIFMASDPMTGALLINIQEVHSSSREKYRSWIFLVDDKGGKALNTVLKDLPTNARAIQNASIFSV